LRKKDKREKEMRKTNNFYIPLVNFLFSLEAFFFVFLQFSRKILLMENLWMRRKAACERENAVNFI
jgi:hypothetical protein